MRDRAELLYVLAMKESLRKNRVSSLYGLVFLPIAVWCFIGGDYLIGCLFAPVGLARVYMALLFWQAYTKGRRETGLEAIRVVRLRQEMNNPKVYEFEADYFQQKDKLFETRIRWAGFTEYKVVERNLLLSSEYSPDCHYIIIGEDEVGTEGFTAIVAFLEGKVKRTETPG
jgi:hypothetical protein